jgi:dihydrofolate reductase
MRKIFLHIIVSLDGYIEGPNGELDWRFIDDEWEEYINSMLRSIDGMLFGRKAYQSVAGYWPTAADNPVAAADPSNPHRHIEAARMMNALPKYVVSTTLKSAEWNNSHIIGTNIVEEIMYLKKQSGKDIALFAGAGLANSLMKHNLIDEYRVIVNPALAGGGKPLFNGGYLQMSLELLDTRQFASGALLLRYASTANK